MPFPDQTPRPFILEAIRALDEGQTGCFGIFRRNPSSDLIEEWIFMGSGNIREELLRHYLGDIACILLRRPKHFVVEDTRRVYPNLSLYFIIINKIEELQDRFASD